MKLWSLIIQNPRAAIRCGSYAILLLLAGWQMLRAERAERKGAQKAADLTVLEARYTMLKASESALQQAIKSYQTAAAQELERRLQAEKKARKVRIQTVERVKVIRESVIPSECTAAIEYGAVQGPIIAEWGNSL